MILVIGGAASGKRTYARSLGYSDDDMFDAAGVDVAAARCGIGAALADGRPVLFNLQALITDAVIAGKKLDLEALADELATRELVICDEVGSGIHPLDEAQIRAREAVGRLTTLLAERATKVVRMVCGIPTTLNPRSDETLKACSSFFQNRACDYFPCHKGVSEEEFNCLLCYCPLYALGTECGGDYTYNAKGFKNCVSCVVPHRGTEGVAHVKKMFSKLAALAAERGPEPGVDELVTEPDVGELAAEFAAARDVDEPSSEPAAVGEGKSHR